MLCNSRCLISGTWPTSRHPTFPASVSSFAGYPGLAAERARKREDLLAATERDLARIQAAVTRKRGPLRGTAEIALAAGAVINKHKMAKHFDFAITETAVSFARKISEIAVEGGDRRHLRRAHQSARYGARPDRSNSCAATNPLALVERAFRCIKTVDLQVRPVHHWLAEQVRAHVFLCMLAYYVEWHMRQRLAPMLSLTTPTRTPLKPGARASWRRRSAFASCTQQADKRLTEDGLAVHSFRSLLADLATPGAQYRHHRNHTGLSASLSS